MWSSMTPSGGSAARAAAITAAIAAGSGPSAPVAAVASGGTGPGTGPAVVSVPCVTLISAPPGSAACWIGSGHPLVGGQGEEIGVLVGQRRLDEQRPGVVPPALGGAGVPARRRDPPPLLGAEPLDELAGPRLAVGEPDAVVQPLPHLAAGDLRGGGVLHEVVDADRARAAQPRLQVLDADADVAAQAGLGALAGRRPDVEHLLGGDRDVLPLR